jgi:hypothetical protein
MSVYAITHYRQAAIAIGELHLGQISFGLVGELCCYNLKSDKTADYMAYVKSSSSQIV